MQLKRLEAYGFKSFADKIEIEFDHGVTAIVGPNGSGKSNITDAIRWVLGERNVRNLRGTKTEDIIFAGSSERRSLGAAEVSLTLLNQGDLPGNFDEIVITRRIFRSGDSEFLLNNTRCHLKDIYEMLADTGLGRDGLSVISQNKMDSVLNSRPEERRLFFEETAGITKFRDRKYSAVRKLEEAEKNLVRLGDIRQGLEDQLVPMAEAAERTKQFNVWNGELRRCKITELFRAQQEMGEKEQASRERFAACQQEEAETASNLISLEAEKEALAKTLIDLQQEGQRKFEARNAQQEKISGKETEIRVLEERRQNSDETQRALKEKREALQTGLAEAKEAVTGLREGEKEALQAQQATEQKLAEAQENVNRIFEELKTRRQARDELSIRFSETQKDFLTKQGELGSLEQNLITSKEARQRQEQEIREGEKRLGENREKLDALSRRISELEEEEQGLLAAQKKAETTRRRIEKLQKERRQTISIARTYIDQTEGKREILQRALESYEGFGNAAKAVLTANEPWKKGICGAVAELIEVPKKYLTAAEAALGGALQNIVTRDTEAAKGAIEYLKRRKAGRATFLPLSTLTVRNGQEDAARKLPGIIGYMNEVIGAAEEYRKAVDFLLARTLLADTMEHALSAAKKLGYRARIVTLTGELLNPGGSISGGSLRSSETGFLNRKEELEALARELTEKEAAIKTAESECAAAEEELREMERQSEADKKRLEDVRVEMSGKSAERKSLSEQMEADVLRLDGLKELVKHAAATFAEAQENRTKMVQAVRALGNEVEELRRQTDSVRDTVADLEQDFEDYGQIRDRLHQELDGLKTEAFKRHGAVLMKEREIGGIEENLAANREEAARLLEGLTDGAEQMQRLVEEKKALLADFEEIDREYKAVDEKRTECMAEENATEGKLKELRRKQGELQERLHAIDKDTEKFRLQREQSLLKLDEDFSLKVDEAAEQTVDMPPGELKSRVRGLERNIAELGPVNPNAVEEYQKLSEQYEKYQKQMQDIEGAKKNFQRLIQELDADMTKTFKAAFAEIQKAFHDIFIDLFGGQAGGDAQLLLTDEQNVLESGVEIVVQIPGKKQQNLSVLSGGERALTVIALLFAFLRVRPAPFSVLDEIDAPLDETNIANFGRFLHKFSEKTQFVVVTHRKGTMESADTMYGVTLEDAGVSKIISVKLEDVPA